MHPTAGGHDRRTPRLLVTGAVAILAWLVVSVTPGADAQQSSASSEAGTGPHAVVAFTARNTSGSATPRWVSREVVAGGVRQWIECAGHGRVTAVVIPGLRATHTMWAKVLLSFARMTRTCIYDRPGLGPSPARSPHATVDAGRHADELMALLAAARITGPLLIVGHSYGGLVARALVARHPTRIAGLMLVEGVTPYDRLSHYWHEGGDTVDTWRSSAAASPMRLHSIPLVVEAAQDPDRSYWNSAAYGATANDISDWKDHQRAAAGLSSNSTFVIVSHSAHVIEHDRPDAVIAGLSLLVRAASTHSRLPRCALKAYGVQPSCR